MSRVHATGDRAELGVESVGGIDRTELSFSPGVTALTGRNATNRTSLLRALMAALGSDAASLKGDADHGAVTLALDGETYTRTLDRRDSKVVLDGDSYLDDAEAADLFAFLLESNEARRAVARDDDLRVVIMRPVDTDAIRADIDRLDAEKRDLDDRLERLDALDSRLADLETEKRGLDGRIADKRDELAEKESAIEDADDAIDDTRERDAAVEDALSDLRETRSALEEARYRLDTERESIAALEDDRATVEDALCALPETPADELDGIETEIDRLRGHKGSLESTISRLGNIRRFNEELLDGDNPELQRALQGKEADAPTDRLVEDTTVCWTCGSEVARGAIEDTTESLRELRREHTTERAEINAELDELTDRRDELRDERDRRERSERKRDEIDREIADRKATLAELEDERAALEDEIEEREAAVEEAEGRERSDLLERHKEANGIEFELGRLERDRDDVCEEIAAVEAELEERAAMEDRRAEMRTELADLRTRIEQLEAEAVAAFNEHMETILGVLDYANIERIWIERTEREVREGRRTVEKGVFDLHVVRRTADGATYEDAVSHLSESEREVTGLVFALAGYLVHDLHESLPFIVVDSLEALDADRIAALVEYFREYATYLVVALLPEDAAALDDAHQRITEI